MTRLHFLLCLLLGASGWGPPGASAATIHVSAAASLTDSLKVIAADYERQSGDKVRFNFGASSFLARQIERSEEHTSELQSRLHLVCRLLLEKKKQTQAPLPRPDRLHLPNF